jgi:peptide/nickel transport system substrate-binding protein
MSITTVATRGMLFCPAPTMKRLSWSLLVVGALVFSSCQRREAPSAPPSTIYRHLVGDPATLDPTTSTEEEGLRVTDLLFRPLVAIDATLAPVPSLARSWSVSPDGLVYEFHLDPNATWESGSAVTSDDVRFTIERVRDPKVNASGWSASFEGLASIETPDPRTVRVRFSNPYAERLVAFGLPIVSAAAYARAKAPGETDRHPVGSGPYRLESWEANQKIRLVRRPEVPPAEAEFSEVVFRVIPNDNTRHQAGVRGELDEFRVTRDQKKTAEASPEFLARYSILRVPQPVEALLLWNCRDPFLSDPRVRRALALSWPREEVARRLYPPDGALLVSGPYPPRVPLNNPAVPPPPYDPAQSARLLDEAGWKAGPDGIRRKGGKKASVDVLVRAQARIDTSLAEILRAAYEKIGVQFVGQALDSAVYGQRGQAGEFEGFLTGQYYLSPNFDPYPYYHSSQFPPKGQNVGYYRNPQADRVMEAAHRELDAGKRLELYREIHRLLAADPPADFLWGADQYWAMAKRVEGVEISPIGLFHFLPGPLGWRPAAAPAR